jgi:MFS family permease
LWIVEIGIFLNILGYGAVLPFEIIYLHEGRGFSLGMAGLIVGLVTGLAVLTAPLAGVLIDAIGARKAATAGGMSLAIGYAGLAVAHSPIQAIVAAVAAGVGNGVLNPSQSALLVSLAAPELRHRAIAISRVAANLGFAFGGALGGLIAALGLAGFVALFLANSVTYVLYVVILLAGVRDRLTPDLFLDKFPLIETPPKSAKSGYRRVLRDRTFIRLALINVASTAVGWGVFSWIVPPYARSNLSVSSSRLGLLFFANALTVVLAQIPVARLAEGRRRVVAMAMASLTWVAACLLVVGADRLGPNFAYTALLLAAIAFALGECLHSTALMPLVADLAPPALCGRYMATIGLSFWLGLGLAPVLGTQLLSISPRGTLIVAAGVALAAGLWALALERQLPSAIRLTPRPSATRGRSK